MFLQKYDFVISYVHGKDVIYSDTLSKAPLKEQNPEIVTFSFSIITERWKHLEIGWPNIDKDIGEMISGTSDLLMKKKLRN